MPGRRFDDGATVMGRWPGSSLYYEVQIMSFDGSTQLYTVRYKDGTELEIKDSDIKAIANFKPKTRRSNSPSRRKSRSRSRSPARTRSPGRTPKKVQQSSPSPVSRGTQKGDILKVHLTPLRLDDYNLRRSNGNAESVAEPVELLREPLRANLSKADKVVEEYSKSETFVEEHGKSVTTSVEEHVRSEKVLRYKPKMDHYAEKENNNIEPIVKSNPVEKTSLEFGGTIGTLLMTLSMPPFLYYLLYQSALKKVDLFRFYPHWTLADLWEPTVLGYFSLWLLLQAFFYLLPIGKVAYGVPLAHGNRLTYRLNGLYGLLLTALLLAGLLYYKVNVLFLYEHYHQFAVAATLVAVLLSVYALARSYKAPAEDLSVAGKSGNFIYTFFMGRELNPRIGSFDLKYFIAIHPALIGWVFVNVVMLLAEMEVKKLEQPSVSMILVNSFQLLYVVYALWNQEGFVTSLDIAHDGFGFMLAFGNLVWVPFAYTLQAVYLVRHSVNLSWSLVAAIVALNALGYFIFCRANNQKLAFRQSPDNPKLSYLKAIPTEAGSKLIVSGLWGLVRHPNYLGDLMMAWAWCLPCGFDSVLPYFYGFFLTGLLLHRVLRVEQQCKMKYGPDWEKYCQHVPYRLFPYLY
ncbi:delta(14)-sterol reductase LBR [Gastrophryne carolinensis]